MACVSCEEKDAEIKRLLKLNAELTLENEKLKSGQVTKSN
jgi:hypothetical protein